MRWTKAIVDHVADGDTIAVSIKSREYDVRLIGIDTLEVYGVTSPECGGPAASRAMKRMLEAGDRVKLFSDPSQSNRDQYGRLLRYVEERGRDVGKRQVAKGHANVYIFGDPFQRLTGYQRAEERARQRDRGVWSAYGGDFHSPRPR